MSYTPAPAHGDCPTGKWQYASRKQARRARRLVADSSLNVYRCPDCSWLHVGHQPQAVRNGQLGKDEWLDARAQQGDTGRQTREVAVWRPNRLQAGSYATVIPEGRNGTIQEGEA